MDDIVSTPKPPQSVAEPVKETASAPQSVAEPVKETASPAASESKKKDNWDKVDIGLRFLGGITTAAVVALVGIFGSIFLADRQEKESNFRLHTELMNRQKEADTSLRREMFSPIFKDLLDPASSEEPEKMVLNLELLATNFHDSLDLQPLFREVYKKLDSKGQSNLEYIDRLTRVTQAVVERQVAVLAEEGGKRDGNVDFESLQQNPEGVTVIDDFISMRSIEPNQQSIDKRIHIEVLSADLDKRQLRVRLVVGADGSSEEQDIVFTRGLFDFPMEENFSLPQGLRCALVLNRLDSDSAEFTFLYFPASKLSKETEILNNLRILKDRSNN